MPCNGSSVDREPDAKILRLLRLHAGGLDVELIVNGYMPMTAEGSVSRALQRLKRRGLVTNDRRWWTAVDPLPGTEKR